MKISINTFINIILVFVNIFIILNSKNSANSLPLIGVMIIITSFLMIYKYRKHNSISLLIGIVMFISISFAYSICLNTYDTAFNWQTSLIGLSSNIVNVKNYLLFLTFFSLSIGNINSKTKNNVNECRFNYNPYILLGITIILIYALIFGFDRGTVGTYSSNTNALYEYAIIFFIYAWKYSENNKFYKKFLLIYAILYCFQGIIFGDRSSCFPMILLLLLLYLKKGISMKHVILVAVCGVLFANMIDIFRNTGNLFSIETIHTVLDRGLFVNTISYSFYGGTQVIRYGMLLSPIQKFKHMLNYFKTFIFGGSSIYNLTVIANAAGFINKGGGMSSTYFYFWGGYFGTIIFAILMGRIINYVFNHDNKLCSILKITITIFSIRWFVYYPTAFFRTAIFVPIVCYITFNVFTKLLVDKKKIN